jgi:hypothetical protein
VLSGKRKTKTNLAICYDIGSDWKPEPRIGSLSRSSLIQTADSNVSKVVHKRTECRDFGYMIVNQLRRHVLEIQSPDRERNELVVVLWFTVNFRLAVKKVTFFVELACLGQFIYERGNLCQLGRRYGFALRVKGP